MTGIIPTASVRLVQAQKNEPIDDAGTGDGPVDAALKTIDRITGHAGNLVDYNVASVTRGKDALGEVSVRVRFQTAGSAGHERIVTGKAASTDTIEASVLAYLNALNRFLAQQRQEAENAAENPSL